MFQGVAVKKLASNICHWTVMYSVLSLIRNILHCS